MNHNLVLRADAHRECWIGSCPCGWSEEVNAIKHDGEKCQAILRESFEEHKEQARIADASA